MPVRGHLNAAGWKLSTASSEDLPRPDQTRQPHSFMVNVLMRTGRQFRSHLALAVTLISLAGCASPRDVEGPGVGGVADTSIVIFDCNGLCVGFKNLDSNEYLDVSMSAEGFVDEVRLSPGRYCFKFLYNTKFTPFQRQFISFFLLTLEAGHRYKYHSEHHLDWWGDDDYYDHWIVDETTGEIIADTGDLNSCYAQSPSSERQFSPSDVEILYQISVELTDRVLAWNVACLAAHLGHQQAQDDLATSYYLGNEPVGKDFVKAYVWYTLAGREKNVVMTTLKSMTLEEIAEAERLVAEWQPNRVECETIRAPAAN